MCETVSPLEKIEKGIHLVLTGIEEFLCMLKDSIKRVIQDFNKAMILIKVKISCNKRAKKSYEIYQRSKNKRIKEKQLKIIYLELLNDR